MTKGVPTLKWEPITGRHPDDVIGWKLVGKNSTLKVFAGEGATWTGHCDTLFDMPRVLESSADVSARREFLKMCLRKARALTSELEGVWTRTEGK